MDGELKLYHWKNYGGNVMGRLDIERQERLEPQRMESTKILLEDMGCKVEPLEAHPDQAYKVTLPDGRMIQFWPYSGWFSGKGIGSGRGFAKLKQAIKTKEAK